MEYEGAWFRAIIDEIGKGATCKVRLIDSGCSTWTEWSKLRLLVENFIRWPAYAAQCKLSDVEATEAQTEWFHEFCDNSPDLFALITAMGSDGCCEVLLYSSDSSSEYKCINQTMPAAPKSVIENDSGNENRVDSSIGSSHRSRPQMIEILHMESLNSFFIELEQDKAGIQRLLTDVQRYACSLEASTIGECKWKVNDYCLVQVQRPNKSPNYWYRGQIVAVWKTKFEVYLRDEGVTVSVKDFLRIRPVCDTLCDVRSRAIECRLSGINPIHHLDDDDVTERFMKIVNKFDRLAVSVQEKPKEEDCILPVLLWGVKMKYDENLMLQYEWSNINRLLVDKRLAETNEKFELVDVRINDEPKIKERIAVEVNNELENVEFVGEEIGGDIDFGIEPAHGHDEYELRDDICAVEEWLPSDKIYKTKYVSTVTYVSTKCVVYVLDVYRRSVAETMQKKITEHVMQQKLEAVHSTDWIKDVGQACFARFLDRNYYRASIRRICREHDYCIVRFIDYGNVEICKMKYIYPAVMFGDVPTLTQTYVFANIRPAYKDAVSDALGRYRWPKAVLSYCFDNLVDHRCVVHVIDDFSDGINTCELFRGENDIEFGAKLVRHDMATYIEGFFD